MKQGFVLGILLFSVLLIAADYICFLLIYYKFRMKDRLIYSKDGMFRYPGYSEETLKIFRSLVDRKANSRDTELLAFVAAVLDPPRYVPNSYKSACNGKTPYTKKIDEILSRKRYGFFVEAGVVDGETSSSSLFFEKKRDWTGLLIEGDPFLYRKLMEKNRSSWSLNGCLSNTNHISEKPLRSMNFGKSLFDQCTFDTVPCFPFETLMLAMNVSQVDFFSLEDVDGLEIEVLKTIPFDRIHIETLAVWSKRGSQEEPFAFMMNRGYSVAETIKFSSKEDNLYADYFVHIFNKTTLH